MAHIDRATRLRELRAAQKAELLAAEPCAIGRMAIRLARHPGAGTGDGTFGRELDHLARDGELTVVHDRRLPRSEDVCDHLVVGPSGLWVVDEASRPGRVALRLGDGPVGPCLVINDRQHTPLLADLRRQVDEVRGLLLGRGLRDVEVRGALCFVDTELPTFQRQLSTGDLVVTWPKALRRRVLQGGTLGPARRTELLRTLATSFPPAA